MRYKEKIPQWLQNPYLIIGLGFLLWMLLFDPEDLCTQYQLWRKLKRLETEKQYYQTQITKVQEAQESLASNKALLEKMAREEYYMKKPTEDLYVVVDP